jgi:hypothetical protein
MPLSIDEAGSRCTMQQRGAENDRIQGVKHENFSRKPRLFISSLEDGIANQDKEMY